MATSERSNGQRGEKLPSRAASLQRLLEMERKQKMERMQQNPYAPAPAPGRRSESPSNSKSNLLTRRRDSSQPPDDHRRSSTVRNYSLPPSSGHSKPPPSSRSNQDKYAKQTQPKRMPPLKETRKATADRDGLPSVKRAVAEHGSPPVKTVSFLPSDDGQSDTSSICHSPTWDDYGKRRKEKEGAARDAKSSKRRLRKEPPPAAMDNRPGINTRVNSAPLLSRTSSEDDRPSDRHPVDPHSRRSRPRPLAQPSQSGPTEPVQDIARSPAFIGGVRLERERDAAMRRHKDTRAPSVERPESEVLQQPQVSRSGTTEPPKRRETAPAVPYPPTSSKTPFLKQAPPAKGHSRKRSGSFTGVVSKLFGSSKSSSQDSQPYMHRRDSEDSVQTVRSLLSLSKRGRQRSGSTTPQSQSRAQSRDNHERSLSTPIDERRGAIGLPPLSWKNSRRKKTASMVAIPPNSSRGSSFPPDGSEAGQENYSFLERPFSPPADGPLSPTASLSASMKAKVNPQASPEKTSRPASPPPRKTFKETIKAGFRSSMSNDPKPAHHRPNTEDTFVIEVEHAPVLSRESHPLQSHPVIRPHTRDRPPSSSRGPQRSDENHSAGQPRTVANPLKDSGASSTSSHPDSESAPPSPVTTPDTSRPQSSKDNQLNLHAEDLMQLPLLSSHVTNTYAVQHPSTAVAGSSARANSLQGNVERPRGGAKEPVSQQTVHRSNFIEEIPEQSSLSGDLWSRSKTPLDTDQLSFTSALTNLDVKRSFHDLGSYNTDFEPFSLDRGAQATTNQPTKVTLKRIQVEVTKSPAYAKKHNLSDYFSMSTTEAAFIPNPSAQAPPPRSLDTTGLKPIAKMFVECCHCRFYQDMPSRVYEAMARPEDTVRDKRLGVSGQVTTCVKCPWCSHNMSTQCCAGYAAVVYLREKLHGV
ncbi:hypothetical protein VPNG_09043 [Cytospora leucostoma]|uniref:Uncharacterized protein n=1 Tax=Cytospora leucostoma TaxID=1230097 RepID=A0A423VZ24_9PEZI|nr:hypothetical protein VPNG_09043 [Cytospora leucostoma]